MRKIKSGEVIFSPTDLTRYMGSAFASWMDRYHLECPGELEPDEATEDQLLIMKSGLEHEAEVLAEFRLQLPDMVEVTAKDFDVAYEETLAAFASAKPLVYQAALKSENFQGHADFVERDAAGRACCWNSNLARSPKPYYIVQLCAYSEVIAAATGHLPDRFGVILGTNDRVEFRLSL